ncbi:MAG: ABC transporter substrate-binding protein [Syntrophomonadaceae bacterium]
MDYRQKKKIMIGLAISLFVLLAGLAFVYNQTLYTTTNLDPRPLNVGAVGKVESIHPAQALTRPERLAASAMYEGLVYYDEASQKLKPNIAKSWRYSATGKTLTIYLKKDIYFQNGKKLTAHDVKSSWEYNFSATKDWYNNSIFLPIVGASEKVKGAGDISGIQVKDDQTIKIFFTQPHRAFIYCLTNPMFWITDVAANPEKTILPPGTGPFILKEIKDQNVLLVRNDKYHRGLPKLAAININLYESDEDAFKDYQAGKIDFLDSVPFGEIKNLKKSEEYKDRLITKPLLETYFLGFNINREPYIDNYLLRRAINYAIDREAIIKQLNGGELYRPLKSVIPMGLAGYNKQLRGYSYDPEKAQSLLDQAGYPNGEGLPVLTLSYNSNPGHQLIAEIIAGQLAEVGIAVQLQEVDWSYYQKQLAKMDVSFFRVGWQPDYPDPDNFLYSLFHSSQMGISNYSGYRNPQVDKLINQSRMEPDTGKRLKMLNRAEQIIIDDAPCVWLFQQNSAKLLGPNVSRLEANNMDMVDWFEVELHKPKLESK